MAREYGGRWSRSGFNRGVQWRYLATLVVGMIAFMIPRVVHSRPVVVLAEVGLWAGFIGWVVLAPRRK